MSFALRPPFRSRPDFQTASRQPPCSQSIHVRALGRAQYRFGGGDVRHVHQHFLGAVHVEYLAAAVISAWLMVMFIVSSLLAAPGFSAFVFHKCREACDLAVGDF